MPALPKSELHERILNAADADVEHCGPLDDVPFLLSLKGVVPLAIWAFTLTSPPGGRDPAESKAQLIVPGQGKGDRGSFDGPAGVFKLLIGVPADEDLFVVWDAYMHTNFAFSKNVQVRGELLWSAEVNGWSAGERRLATGPERVLVARGDHLVSVIRRRISGG
jgi:Methylase-associated X1